ncbi:hypothetical protein [Dyadobacter pollutisoli]|jgi:hypothetical protein|uniref:Uncharacterized protein n=1 Tax=Dyadobacter pollutisoli TaxID=2910158 RepID=A0A9E8NDZ4_9BACT|nr:hypothetical protein [Dyadobacter pollutisoli]WAC12776.1 hypothetical protein ON006_02185 [Dyadobacter pollutisoli]
MSVYNTVQHVRRDLSDAEKLEEARKTRNSPVILKKLAQMKETLEKYPFPSNLKTKS